MKELSIEEKAKRYNEAIEMARKVAQNPKNDYGQFCSKLLTEIFPELAESNDEKVRKEMIFYFTEEIPQCSIQEHADKMKEFISWLERQEVERTKLELKAGNSYFCYKSRWERADSETFKKGLIYKCNKDGVLDNFVIKNPEQHFIEIKDERIACLEKQGEQKSIDPDTLIQQRVDALAAIVAEQKPADKIKPKFKVGDWIVQGCCNILKIRCVGDEYYCYETVGGYIDDMLVSEIDSLYHLWTIQDAKDGDVLCSESGWICIFKALDNHRNTFSSYCFMDSDKWFCNTGCTCHTLDEQFIKAYNFKLHPATKEQHDQLEKAMADAGYTFDFEKKVLRKIEQKPVEWSKEDEEMLDDCETAIYSSIAFGESSKDKMRNWLKSLRPQNRWKPTKEQIHCLKDAINRYKSDGLESLYNYLKLL